ncbi:class I tRNA ligase family protein, partial [candidate division WOR-3 bacterium]|nr:class I tRNA ligase family protein [candidate division WOR-3 bacterium]
YPARWKGVYDHWLKNINDWCISRQLWWGHRIPVYYCNKCSNEFVSVKNPGKCPKCNSTQIKQDDNVLDTWFSSWLWPFSTLGWLKSTEEFKYYYPTNVIVSASEILFFWISRMVIAGLHFTGELPFKDIYIHGTVRDENGRKMSKSLGNGIDPLEISKKYGVDALRFSLIFLSGQGKDPNINKSTFELGRNFANKIWNGVRFIVMKTDNVKVPKNVEPSDIFDIWILNRLDEIIENAEKNLSKYRFYDYANDLYEFFWHDFCDWYLEIIKIRKSGFDIALFVINRYMTILNPIMPFISEEINELIGSKELIHERVIEKTGLKLHNAENEINIFKSSITAIRNLIADTGFKKIDILINNKSSFLEKHGDLIKALCKCESINFVKEKPIKAIPSIFNEGMIFIKAKNIENIDNILQEYSKELKNINIQIDKTEKTLSNEQFMEKAKKEVIDAMKEKGKIFYDKKKRILEIIGSLK